MDKVLSDIDTLRTDVQALAPGSDQPTVADVVTDLKAIVEKYDVIVEPAE